MTSDARKEFLQKYMLDSYSRAIPTKVIPGKASLGEYCEPIDSRKSHKRTTEDSDDYSSDPDQRYAQPQDAIDIKREIRGSHSKVKDDDFDDGNVYELAQQPMEENDSPPKKPSPKPRGSRHGAVRNEYSASSDQNTGSESVLQKSHSSSKADVKNSDLGTEIVFPRKRVGKKVVEIEYEEARPRDTQSTTSHDLNGAKFSIKRHDQAPLSAPISSQSNKPFLSKPDSRSLPPTPSAGPHHLQKLPKDSAHKLSQPVLRDVGGEDPYEEPWDLKIKRLKQEQEKKGKKPGSKSDKHSGLAKTPSIYEDAWDSPSRKQKLEERLSYARSLSQTSETEIFHDALESMPEQKVNTPSSQNLQPDPSSQGNLKPLPGNTYEDAWDLKNSILEQKIREMQLQASATYEEPWDSKKQQQAMQAKLQAQTQSTSSGGTNDQGKSPRRSHSDAYDAAWDAGRPRSSGMRDKTLSIDESRMRSKVRGCNVGQQINPMIPLSSQNWYHGNISRDDAEKMLCVCKEGSYIVRISSDRKSYSLSIKSAKQYIHVQIEQRTLEDGTIRYILGKNSKEFCTIPEMIDYYTHHRVPLKGAEHITLLHPVECKWS